MMYEYSNICDAGITMENPKRAQSARPTCTEHDGEELDTYCHTCEKRTCEICCKTKHSRHDWTTTGRVAKQRRNQGEAIARDIKDNLQAVIRKGSAFENISKVKAVEEKIINYTRTYVASLVTKLGVDDDGTNVTEEIDFLTRMAEFFENKVHLGENMRARLQFEPPTHLKILLWARSTTVTDFMTNIYNADYRNLAINKHFQWIPVTDFWRLILRWAHSM